MSRVHCRCRYCDTRRVLPKHPDQYKVCPQCRVCGKRWVTLYGGRYLRAHNGPTCDKVGIREPIFRVDQWMINRDTRSTACDCGGYTWEGTPRGAMHRKGSLKCWFRADGSAREWGDSDYYIDPAIQNMDYEHG